MTHVVFSLESKTFLAKPLQEKAGIYKAKNEGKKHISCQLLLHSLFKVFSFPLSPFLINTTTKTFVCFDFQNPTASKHEEISMQPADVTGTLQHLSHTENIQSAVFLESTEQHAAQIFLMSVLEAGSPLTETSQPSLAHRTCFITSNRDAQHAAKYPVYSHHMEMGENP